MKALAPPDQRGATAQRQPAERVRVRSTSQESCARTDPASVGAWGMQRSSYSAITISPAFSHTRALRVPAHLEGAERLVECIEASRRPTSGSPSRGAS